MNFGEIFKNLTVFGNDCHTVACESHDSFDVMDQTSSKADQQ